MQGTDAELTAECGDVQRYQIEVVNLTKVFHRRSGGGRLFRSTTSLFRSMPVNYWFSSARAVAGRRHYCDVSPAWSDRTMG